MTETDGLFKRLEQLNEIGAALSKERNINRLLESILVAAKTITHADGGTLYRVTEDGTALRFEIMRTDSLGMTLAATILFGCVAAAGCTLFPKLPLRLMYFSNREMWEAAPLVPWFAWALLSAFFAGVTAILAKLGVSGVNSNLATAIRTTVVLVFAWGIAFATSRPFALFELPRRTWLFLALSGLATGLSWICYFRALQLGPASRVAPLDKLSVPLVMLFAWLLLGEKLTASALAGGLLITAGAMVIALG